MESNILFGWKYWLYFYYFLSYALCFVLALEWLFKICSSKVLPANMTDMREIKKGINCVFFGSTVLFRYLIYAITFIGAIEFFLTNTGVKHFTTEYLISFFFAFAFSNGFYFAMTKMFPMWEEPTLRTLQRVLVLITFVSFFVVIYKLPSLIFLYTGPGQLVYKCFLIPWFPPVLITLSTLAGGSFASIVGLFYIPFSLIVLFNAIMLAIYFIFKIPTLTKYGDFCKPGEIVDSLYVEVTRGNLNSIDTYETVGRLEYPVLIKDKEIARSNPDTLFAKGITENPHYEITPMDIQAARNNPQSKFTISLENKLSDDAKIPDNVLDTRKFFSGKLLTKNTCVCAFCGKEKKFGAKLDATPNEVDKRPLIICLDCHTEQMASFHGIPKKEASRAHNILSNKALRPAIKVAREIYLKKRKRKDFDSPREKEMLLHKIFEIVELISLDKKLKDTVNLKSVDELEEVLRKTFSEPRVSDFLSTKKTSFSIGRNDPCFCGSGKKYKRCCLSKVA